MTKQATGLIVGKNLLQSWMTSGERTMHTSHVMDSPYTTIRAPYCSNRERTCFSIVGVVIFFVLTSYFVFFTISILCPNSYDFFNSFSIMFKLVFFCV